MHWEAAPATSSADPGWHADPLDAERLRWWDGRAWTARVVRLDPVSDAISWHADVPTLPAPERVTEPPPMATPPLDVAPAPLFALFPTLVDAQEDALASAADFPQPTDDIVVRPKRWSRHARPVDLPSTRRGWAILAAAVALLVAGAGVGAAVLGEDDRPTIAPTLRYADEAADVTFKYPDKWRVEAPTDACPRSLPEDECVRVVLEIGPDVSADDANTLQVRSFNTEADLDALHEWVTTETAAVVEQIPTIELVSAAETRLADAPAFMAELTDKSSPTTRLVVYEGRATSGRALVVTLTVRDPRTAPSDEEFKKLLASITST